MPAKPETGRDLHSVLRAQRRELIDRWSKRVTDSITAEPLPRAELIDQIPAFVDELTAALYPDAAPLPPSSEHALEHGAQRLRLGFNIREVVREYGMLELCILELARDAGVPVGYQEQSVLAGAINTGLANAVSQYVTERDAELQRQTSEHLAFIAHELRAPLNTAWLVFQVLRKRELASGGRTVEQLDRNLRRTAELIDGTLTHASLRLGISPKIVPLKAREMLEDIARDAAVEAQVRDIQVSALVEPELVIEGDARLLRSAIANLVRNAIKFSAPGSTVLLRAEESDGRVLIDVEDRCGGLPAGKIEELFTPLVQRGADRSGFGLGLPIALQAAEAHHGTIRVRDLPGKGCVFTVDLPAMSRS